MNFNTCARFNRAGTFNTAIYQGVYKTELDIDTLDVEKVIVSQSVQDQFPTLSANIIGYYSLSVSPLQYCYYDVADHLAADQDIFSGIIPKSSISFDSAANKTEIVAYGLGWYLSQQYVPEQCLHNTAGTQPAITIREILGGDEWPVTSGIDPYRIMPVSAWGDTLSSKVFDFQRTTTKKEAIQRICDYTRHIFSVRIRDVDGVPTPSAYFIHEDDIDTYGDLPSPVTITNPDGYLDGKVSALNQGDELYNKVQVFGRASTGSGLSASYQSDDVINLDEFPIEVVESSGAYATQSQCNNRVSEQYDYYATLAPVFTATFNERMDFRLFQKIKFSGYMGIPTDWMRITNIRYEVGPTPVKKVTIEVTPVTKFSNIRRMYRSMAPDNVSETESIFDSKMSQIPGNEIGTITEIDGYTATVQLEDGRTVTARII